ncbi:MAG: FlgD immunoglobulin-like domain containing protein [Elusimicrobiota bacterium]|nr:FlgD immunoglobulin-like domain containing protein [Elusimicrobiota bacterium]
MRAPLLALLLALAAPAAAVPTFSPDGFVSLTTATPLAFDSVGTYPMRLYFMRHASSDTDILSATSPDGQTWTVEAGSRLSTRTVPSVSASSITGLGVLPLTGGGFRAVYSIISTTGSWRVHTATSADGFSWANDTGTAFEYSGGADYVAAPALVKLDSGDWRVFFVRDQNGGNDPGDRRVYSALSTNQGRNWGAASLVISTVAHQVGAAKRADGRVRVFYSQPLGSASSTTVVSSSLSDDATAAAFTAESGYRASTGSASGSVSFPVPARSTDSFRWRLYYGYSDPVQPSSGSIYSVLNGPPDFISLSPDSVYTSAGAAGFTLRGEVFSAGPPQVVARKSGETDVAATAENRTDDQTMTFTLDMQGRTIGYWDLVITNADGNATTANARLLVDFAPGSVTLTNNLLRPRNGTVMNADVTTFNAGRVVLRVYTPDGRLVRTLHDADRPAGSFTATWDAKDAQGATVASGLYILRTTGPRLDGRSKILVIK